MDSREREIMPKPVFEEFLNHLEYLGYRIRRRNNGVFMAKHEIVPWGDTGKYCLEFAESAHEIEAIKLDPSRKGIAPQAPRYTSMSKLTKAKVLSDIY